MKYTITVNQYAAVENNLGLDFIDLIVFEVMKSYSLCDTCKKVQTDEGVFFWMSHEKIREELPLLGIQSDRGIRKRIDNIVSSGLLERSKESENFGKSLYRIGQSFEKYEFHTPVQNAVPRNESSTPGTKVPPPRNESSTNNNTNYNKSLDDNNARMCEELKNSPQYIEIAAKQNGITKKRVLEYIDQFNAHLALGATIHSDRQDFIKHFRDWMRIKAKQDATDRTNIQDKRRAAKITATSWEDYECDF